MVELNIKRYNKSRSILVCVLTLSLIPYLLSLVSASYAQEQYVAESFGLHSKGIEHYHAGRYYEAEEMLERAIELDPRNDEAKGYLDLVRAEIRKQERNRRRYDGEVTPLPSEDADFDRRLARFEQELESKYGDNADSGYTTGEEDYEYYRPDKEPTYSKSKIKAVTETLNERIAPARVKGEYRASFGVTSEDVIWKDANGDYNERNFRMISHDYPKINTYDKRIYDRFKVVFDTNTTENGFNFHSDITVDPWSFVGKTDKFTVVSDGAGTDQVELELKYWSGTRSTVNETFYTSNLGDSLSTSEYKVTEGKIPSFQVSSTWSTFTVPEKEIDYSFQPIRELWFDYGKGKEDYNVRVFPFALEDQALSSDDPLGLSNHHIYWESSPWLDEWIPGHVNTGATPNDFWRGRWSNDLAFFTRDSNLKRLTALRGASFKGNLSESTELTTMVASPKTLWQDYGTIRALAGALRSKTQMTDNLTLGFTDTFRIGYNDDKKDATNYVAAADISYDLSSDANLAAEVAYSETEKDITSSTYKTEDSGSAVHVRYKRSTFLGESEFALTHMDEGFDAGLTNYKETRKDISWSRHIHFKKPFYNLGMRGDSPMNYDDIASFRIGDGIDQGRNVFRYRLKTEGAFQEKMDNLIDFRYVNHADDGYVESVLREENTFRFAPRWTSKVLAIYHHLPDTTGGIDPIMYDSDTGEYLENTAIEDGKDPSVSTYSLGVEYEPAKWVSVFGIYENTNDYRYSTGNHPNGLLNDTYFDTESIEGNVYRKEVPFLYSQSHFDQPPYDRFHIWRGGIQLRPSERMAVDFDYTKNDFKFAQGIDDNINHFGTSVGYRFNNRLVGYLKYTFSRANNIYRLNTDGGLKYEDHHNVYMKFDYVVTESSLLTVEFGEGAFIDEAALAGYSPFGDFYPVLDTRHILRVYYHGTF